VTLHRRGLFEPDARLLNRLPRIVVASAIMAGFLLLAHRNLDWLYPWLFNSTLLVLAVVCAAGLVVFALAAVLTGALRLSEVRTALKRS
jgi:putative peptidoglycan lipid II flippase